MLNSQTQQNQFVIVKLMHEDYLYRWLRLYEFDEYKRWLFLGLIKILRRYVKNGTILEIGCAKGYLTDMLNRDGYQAVGGDISRTALRAAKKIEKLRLDGEVLPFKDNVFDAVLAVSTIEHTPKPFKAINEISRV